MRYRTKLVLILTGVASLASLVAAGLVFLEFRASSLDDLRSKSLSIAQTTAAMLDGDAVASIRSREDETLPQYESVREALRAARDANRRDDAFVRYIYTLVPSREDGRTLVYGVDPEEDFKDVSHPGDVFRSEGDPVELGDCFADSHVRQDAFGRWFSAFAPVRDSRGEIVAQVGVDVPADDVSRKLLTITDEAALGLAVAIGLAWVAARLVAGPATRTLREVHAAVDRIAGGDLDVYLKVKGNDEVAEVAHDINNLAEKLREREKLRGAFARYVSQQVMDTVLQSENGAALDGQRRRVTLLFADIRGFTTLSEHMRPEEVVSLLNEYFERMIDVILRNGGTLDKFIGDGLMAIFGAPGEDLLQEEHAVSAAIQMQQELATLRKKWAANGRPEVHIGIGVHSGTAIVGNIGSSQRMQYTAIGDTVNVASRLESATKDLGVPILVSDSTSDGCRGTITLTRLGEVHVKGRGAPVSVFGVAGDGASHAQPLAQAA